MLIDWNNTYSVGIDEIDEHHKKLIDLLNKSYIIIIQEAGQEELYKVLYELIDYANYHFSFEEDLMRKYHYQNIDQHIIEHFTFVNQVLKFEREISENKALLTIDVFNFIKDWLLNHILETDLEMGNAIQLR